MQQLKLNCYSPLVAYAFRISCLSRLLRVLRPLRGLTSTAYLDSQKSEGETGTDRSVSEGNSRGRPEAFLPSPTASAVWAAASATPLRPKVAKIGFSI